MIRSAILRFAALRGRRFALAGAPVASCGRPGRRTRRPAFGVLAALALGACGPPMPREIADAPKVASSAQGVVVAAQPLAAEAGTRMLRAGGNAADAAVAAAFAVSVVEPSMNSIGGRTQILVRTAEGEFAGIDATTQAPATYDPETAPQASYGYETVGVPGALAGLVRLLEDHGTLPLEQVMAPAIALAEYGFHLLPGEAGRHADGAAQLGEFPGSRAHFLMPGGKAHPPGDLFVQPALGATLRTIAEGGAEVFYRGEIARKIANNVSWHGGAVTAQSLADYRAEDSRVVRGSYRDYDLVGTDLPASGAATIGILHVLERFDLAALDRPQWAALVGTAVAEVFARTAGEGGRTDEATSKAWAAEIAAGIELPGVTLPRAAEAPGEGWRRTEPVSVFRRTPVQGLAASGWAGENAANRRWKPAESVASAVTGLGSMPTAGQASPSISLAGLPEVWTSEDSHTTHLSTGDANGMYVSLTQTIGPNLGSKVATPGLGFLYAATLGGYLGRMEPGERASSSISPLMVLRDGEPALVLGAAGGSRIVSAVVQAVLRVVDHGMPLAEALAAARVHPVEGGVAMETSPEIGWGEEDVAMVQSWGLEAQPIERAGAFGRIHGIQIDPATGRMTGVADPDWEGAAIVPDRR